MATVEEVVPKTVLEMLKEFCKQPGCEVYAGDGKRADLLNEYLWVRQLAPGLTLETFLERFAPLADHNDENRKHPDEASRFHCPRAKSQADKLGVRQWAAKEVVNYQALYVDMIREAEAQATPVPMTYDVFLGAMREPFLAGEFNVAPPPPAPKAKKAGKAKAEPGQSQNSITTPTGPGQRVLYNDPSGQQFRGMTTEVNSEKGYVSFTEDSGQEFDGVAIGSCAIILDPPEPALPPELVAETKTLWLPTAQIPAIEQSLALTQPMGNTDVGVTIYPFTVNFDGGLAADLHIVNGETGPYVNPELADPAKNVVLADLPPRRRMVGEYRFLCADRYYVVHVKKRGQGGDA